MNFTTVQTVTAFLATNKEGMDAENMLAVAIAYALPVPTMATREDYHGVYLSKYATVITTEVLCKINEERLIDIKDIADDISAVWHYRCASLWEYQFEIPEVLKKMTIEDWHRIENLVMDLKVGMLA